MMRLSEGVARVWTALASTGLFVFLFLPILSLFVTMSPAAMIRKLAAPVAFQALWLSLATTFQSLGWMVLFGTPLAYMLAKRTFPGKRLMEVLVQLPVVTPPAVAGVGLLLAFGRAGLLGHALEAGGIHIAFSRLAVVMAQTYVAVPLYLQSARDAFLRVDDQYLQVSRTLGVSRLSTFFRVTLPLAFPGVLSGAALGWARALGEFGATMMFAGNLPGKTQTLSLAIYSAMQSDFQVAVAVSALLMTAAFVLLAGIKWMEYGPGGWWRREGRGSCAAGGRAEDVPVSHD
jgi:molybdate transport system permease protein